MLEDTCSQGPYFLGGVLQAMGERMAIFMILVVIQLLLKRWTRIVQTMVDQGLQAGSTHTHDFVCSSPVNFNASIVLWHRGATEYNIMDIARNFILLFGLQDPVITHGDDL